VIDTKASNILVCLRYGIGDLIMELPALDCLREYLPHARITGLGAEPAIEVLDRDRRLDEVVPIQRWGIRHLGDTADEPIQGQFADWLTGRRFDRVLDPSHAAVAIRQIIHQQTVRIHDSDAAHLEAGLAQGLDGLSAVMQGIRQGWGLEIPTSCYPTIPLHPEEIAWARQFLKSSQLASAVTDTPGTTLPDNGLIAISPGASNDLKRWPADRFAQLCRFATEELGVGIVLFCGPGEARVLHDLMDRIQDLPGIEIVQNLHLRRVAALLSHCSLYVGNDSGLMHLAAAVQIPVVALFGPTLPHLYLPRWIRSRAVVSPVACPHRPRRAFGHPRCVLAEKCLIGDPCIQAIEPPEVLDVVKEAWRDEKGGV
jgi:ADP-heptose:LPS heptosyltransferase